MAIISGKAYSLFEIRKGFSKVTRYNLKEFLRANLRSGVHPFFLEQVTRMLIFIFPAQAEEIDTATKQVLQDSYSKFQAVPEPLAEGHHAPVSRIYSRGGKPIVNVDEGVIHGSLVETILVQWVELSAMMYDKIPGWEKEWTKIFSQFAEHPNANVFLLDNILQEMNLLGRFAVKQAREISKNTTVRFVAAKIKTSGIEQFVGELLDLWDDRSCVRFWEIFVVLLELILKPESGFKLEPKPMTRILRFLLDEGQKKSKRGAAATRVLSLFPDSSISADRILQLGASAARVLALAALKLELPDTTTFHTILRWIQVVPLNVKIELLFGLLFGKSHTIDESSEVLIEQLLGHETWQALCRFQEPRFWEFDGNLEYSGIEVKYREGLKMESTEFKTFVNQLKQVRFDQHNWRLAEYLDIHIDSFTGQPSEANAVWEQAVNLLAGDVLLTVTHLRTEWMPVRRRENEYMSTLFPHVEVAKHSILGENGAACVFRITFPDLANDPVTGSLDAEGSLSLDRICALTPQGRLVLQAVVAQTLAAVLIPRYLDKFPPKRRAGFRVSLSGELWASRPVVHRLGELSKDREHSEAGSGGSRIHPDLAEWLFEWLLDIILDQPFRLHRKMEERIGDIKDVHFPTWLEAKEELKEKRIGLSDVYYRTIRAHSRPTAVYLNDSGNVVVQKMSSRAQRNYERFLADVGRALDFSPVNKTYDLDGRRIPLTVPRTFNKGAFSSLREVWEMIADPALKERARQAFLLE